MTQVEMSPLETVKRMRNCSSEGGALLYLEAFAQQKVAKLLLEVNGAHKLSEEQ